MDLIRRAFGRRSAAPSKERRPATPGSKPPRTPPALLPKDDLHSFWRDPDATNRPERYIEHPGRSAFLLEFARPYISPESTILEVGCNVGRNLAHIFDAGYHRLAGIEINGDALDALRRTYPEMAAATELINAPVEEAIKAIGDDAFDTVYTMAVLEHIHPDSEWVFAEMVRVAKSTIITIEDEQHVSQRHVPRDYRAIFEALGMRQVAHRSLDRDMGFGGPYEARAFSTSAGG
ncbi:MAG TPA: class I SAM-dependent methyltransferase [Candidatus Limnocylindrales bacterium]|nr:class I SAM-dependent methyltransferase [Candidatus Limnocylindrales bacterium]